MTLGTKSIFTFCGTDVLAGDIFMVLSMIPMYYEMIRMAIALFRRLKEYEK
jgi:hypothetical protein